MKNLFKNTVLTFLLAYVSFEIVMNVSGNEITSLATFFGIASFGLLGTFYSHEASKTE